MEEMIYRLIQQIEAEKSNLECLEKKYESARSDARKEFTVENCRRCDELSKRIGESEYTLRNFRTALMYLYKGVGFPEAEVNDHLFEPEKF